MKKIFSILTIIFILSVEGLYANADVIPILPYTQQGRFLMELDEYKNINPDNIKSMSIIRYTEAGASEKEIKDRNEINQIYNYLKQIRLFDETKMSCLDNTTIYKFILKDDSKAAIEIECDWVVIKGKNYNMYLRNRLPNRSYFHK